MLRIKCNGIYKRQSTAIRIPFNFIWTAQTGRCSSIKHFAKTRAGNAEIPRLRKFQRVVRTGKHSWGFPVRKIWFRIIRDRIADTKSCGIPCFDPRRTIPRTDDRGDVRNVPTTSAIPIIPAIIETSLIPAIITHSNRDTNEFNMISDLSEKRKQNR